MPRGVYPRKKDLKKVVHNAKESLQRDAPYDLTKPLSHILAKIIVRSIETGNLTTEEQVELIQSALDEYKEAR